VIATSRAAYQSYISTTATKALGKSEFQGVCATCHGMQGQGGYGKVLQTSSLVTQRSAVADILRNGRNLMPPVGNTWTNRQIDAVVAYMKAHIYKGAAPSGG
jgi:mono/diheme cytochrome c family protein